MRIVFTGGGTGGHLVPFAPIIEALRSQFLVYRQELPPRIEPKTLDLYFLGILNKADTAFWRRYDVKAFNVPSGKLRRYFSFLTATDLILRLPLGLVLALFHMWRIMPDAVVSKGGYGSLPVVLAAAFYRVPVLLHESDAVPGLANQIALRLATAVAVGFEGTKEILMAYKEKVFVVGTPVREEFERVGREESRKIFDIAPEERVLLVMGGSQGSEQINEVLLSVLSVLVQEATIIHLTGEDHFEKIRTVTQELLSASSRNRHYKPYPYLSDTMPQAMMAADVVVSRAGATTLAELTRLRKPALLIPLPGAANDHQRRNARIYEQNGAARVLEPTNLGRSLFLRNVRDLLRNEKVRGQLSTQLQQMDRPEAAQVLAQLALRLAAGFAPRA